jgi:mRNA-degrading endonuclease toxin of MazEF toxin-antitoxin module
VSDPQGNPEFGDIWTVDVAGVEEQRLVVAGAFYHSIQPHTTVMVPIHPELRTVTLFSVNVEGHGWVALDQPSTIFRHRLKECVGAIPPELYDKVRGTMRLIFDISGDS